MPKAESKSADLIQENIEQLKQIFPEIIKEGRVDFDALNDLLGNYADTPEERFYLNWAGKANARREAQKRSTGTLRPCPEESVDWDITENLYIEGDNLEVLKLMQKSYHNMVKMIYIDPPYNTGNDFVYNDDYTDNMKNYLEQTGQDKKLSTNTESEGRYHSNWLNMMYPRLKLARNLLTDDGVIFISIDDNEVTNCRKLCDEIFGEENLIENVIWKNKYGAGAKTVGFISAHEYILCYSKNKISNVTCEFEGEEKAKYNKKDEKFSYRGPYRTQPLMTNSLADRLNLMYPIEYKGKEIWPKKQWVWSKDRMLQAIENNDVEFSMQSDGSYSVRSKSYLYDENGDMRRGKPVSVMNGPFTQDGTKEIRDLFEDKSVFDFSKPSKLIQFFLKLEINDQKDIDFIVLDFFSGSATTAHAVMQLNVEDGGNRKYICVQLPEPTPEDSEARKSGYNTIPEIAKERIRRAGKKILKEQQGKAQKEGGLFAEEKKKLDFGFKVFKLDSSNINAWDNDPNNLDVSLHNSLFNIKTDRSEDDLLYEILIKYGIELTEKINRNTIAGKTVYEMGAGSLIVCLADNLTTDVAEGIGKLYKEVKPKLDGVKDNCRVVFKDSGFNGSDEVKTNTMLILKQHGILNVASV